MERSPTAAKSLGRQIATVLRFVAIVRQQRALLHRIDHRVGQLEERLNVAFVHTADQADTLVELEQQSESCVQYWPGLC